MLVAVEPGLGRAQEAVIEALDQAAACKRRQKPTCQLKHAERALKRLTDTSPQPLRVESLTLASEALVRLERVEDASALIKRLLALVPGWRPGATAPEAYQTLVAELGLAALKEKVGTKLSPPLPKIPLPPDKVLAPEPLIYAPDHLRNLDPTVTHAGLRLNLGGGVAFLGGASADRYDTGLVTALELQFALSPMWALRSQATMSLHGIAGGLTTIAGTFGVQLALELSASIDIVLALGVGGGAFGVRSLSEVAGLCLDLSAGARVSLAAHMAIRLDIQGVSWFPIDAAPGPASTLSLLLKPEISF